MVSGKALKRAQVELRGKFQLGINEELEYRSICRQNVRDTLMREFGLSKQDADAYAVHRFAVKVPSIAYEDSDKVRSVDVTAKFEPPEGTHGDATKLKLRYYYRPGCFSCDWFADLHMHGAIVFKNYLHDERWKQRNSGQQYGWGAGDSDESDEEVEEPKFIGSFALNREQIRQTERAFAGWAAKGFPGTDGSTGEDQQRKEIARAVLKVLFSGVGIEWSSCARSQIDIHEEANDSWLDKQFDCAYGV